jgi:zinc protease
VKTLHAILTSLALAGCANAAAAQAGAPAAGRDTVPRANRQPPPPAMASRPMQFPAYTESTLPNGLRLLVVESHARPLASLDLYVRTGSAADPAGKLGLARLTADLLTKGSPGRTAKQIAEQIEGAGGSLDASADDDYVAVSAGALSDQVQLAFELLSEAALHPTFADDEVQTSRTRELSTLQSQLGQPGTVASRAFYAQVYGPHPYGRARTPATVGAITRADIQRFHDTYFKPGNALLVVAGDVTPARARELATRYFGSWTGSAPPAAALPAVPGAGPTRIVLVNRPGSVQSNVVVGNLGIRPTNPDYFPLIVMNQILGGGSDARLFEILRQQHGWTYGSYSSLSRPNDVGVFSATAEVRTEVTDSALNELLAQVRRMRTEAVGAPELQAAKSYLVGSYPLRYETPGQIADRLARIRLLGVPVTELTQYRERVSAVTAADIQRVARQYLQPDRMTIVVVGDAAKVLPRLRGIGPVTLVDVEGRPVDPASLEVRASTERYDASRLQPVTLTYNVSFNGNVVATTTSTLARDGQNWVATQTSPANSSEVRFTNDFTPISAHQAVPMQGVDVTLAFANGRVTGTAKLPAQMGGDKAIDMPVVAGTRPSGVESWVLAASDLAVGKNFSFPVFSATTSSVLNATARVVGTEQVTVPAGTFTAFKVELSAGPQNTTLWLRSDAPHLSLKQAIAGQPVVVELQSIR